MTAGKNFADGKGNFAIAGEYSRDGADHTQHNVPMQRMRLVLFALLRARNMTESMIAHRLTIWAGMVPSRVAHRCRSAIIFYPRVRWEHRCCLGLWQLSRWSSELCLSARWQRTPTSGYSGWLEPDIKRYDFNVFGHYDITPNIRFFTEMKYVQTNSLNQSSRHSITRSRLARQLLPAALRTEYRGGGHR